MKLTTLTKILFATLALVPLLYVPAQAKQDDPNTNRPDMLDPYGHAKDDRMDTQGNRGRPIDDIAPIPDPVIPPVPDPVVPPPDPVIPPAPDPVVPPPEPDPVLPPAPDPVIPEHEPDQVLPPLPDDYVPPQPDGAIADPSVAAFSISTATATEPIKTRASRQRPMQRSISAPIPDMPF